MSAISRGLCFPEIFAVFPTGSYFFFDVGREFWVSFHFHVLGVPFNGVAATNGHGTEQNDFGEIGGDVEVGAGGRADPAT